MLLPLTIPRSGAQFPGSGLVCMSVFQRRCANSELSPRRLDIPMASCFEHAHSCRELEGQHRFVCCWYKRNTYQEIRGEEDSSS